MYRAAIVGTGFIAAEKHLPAWRRLRREVKVVAVCDIDLPRAEAVRRAFGVPRAYADAGRMIAAERPDFVDICTPPDTHAVVAEAALAADADVMIEKPLATTPEDCERIIAAQRRSKGRVEVAHTELFHPLVAKAQRAIKGGEIGDFVGMRIFYSTPVSLFTAVPDHFVNRLPGGAVGETGPHVAYLSEAFIGPIRKVWARGRKITPEYVWSPFEDYRLELMGDQAVSSVVLTYTSEHSAFLLELWGADGVLKIDMQGKVLVNYRRSNRSPFGIGWSLARESAQIALGACVNGVGYLAGRFRNIHDRLIAEFVRRSVKGLSATVTAQDGLRNVQVMNSITAQLQSQAEWAAFQTASATAPKAMLKTGAGPT